MVCQAEKIDIGTEYFFRVYAQLFLHCVVRRAETIASVLKNCKKRQLNKFSVLLLSLAGSRNLSLFEVRKFYE